MDLSIYKPQQSGKISQPVQKHEQGDYLIQNTKQTHIPQPLLDSYQPNTISGIISQQNQQPQSEKFLKTSYQKDKKQKFNQQQKSKNFQPNQEQQQQKQQKTNDSSQQQKQQQQKQQQQKQKQKQKQKQQYQKDQKQKQQYTQQKKQQQQKSRKEEQRQNYNNDENFQKQNTTQKNKQKSNRKLDQKNSDLDISQIQNEQPIDLTNFKSVVDKTGRYYPNIINQDECEKEYKLGVWTNNKCWKDPEYALCETTTEETPQCKYNPYSGKYISTKYLETMPDDLNVIQEKDRVDMQQPKFQKRILQYFTGQLSKKMPVYQNPLATEFIDACNQSSTNVGNSKRQPTIAQSLMNIIGQLMQKFPQQHRGVLCFHSLGSGKSCTSTAIMDAYWDTDRKIYYITTFSNLKSVKPQEYRDCIRLFPKFKNLSKEDAEKKFQQRNVEFISFQQAANLLGIGQKIKKSSIDAFKNSLLLIDEVQNIFTPISTQKEGIEKLKKFFVQKDNSHLLNTHIYGLTATPGNTPEQIVQLINMFRGQTQTELQVPTTDLEFEEFQKQILGMISYIDNRKDFTRFPRVYNDDYQLVKMSEQQFQTYREKLKDLKKIYKKETDYQALQKENQVDEYYKTLRRYSNMLLNYIGTDNLETYSHKLAAIVNKIQQFPNDKQYIYSAFFVDRGNFGGQGIRSIGYALQKFAGYEQVTIRDFYEAYRKKQKLSDFLTPGKKRFFLLLTPEFEKHKIPQKYKDCSEMFLDYFNDHANSHGEYVQLMLTSGKFNEGLDLKDVQHIHIFEPFVQKAADEQTIGRAARSCSHKNLKFPQEWIVQVHRYISDFPSTYKLVDRELLQTHVKRLQEKNNELTVHIQQLYLHIDSNYTNQEGNQSLHQQIQTWKLKIQNNEQSIKVIQDQLQKIEKEGNLIPIDYEIFRISELKYGTLRKIYQIIQNSAIDCVLLNKLANYPGNCYLDQIDNQQTLPQQALQV